MVRLEYKQMRHAFSQVHMRHFAADSFPLFGRFRGFLLPQTITIRMKRNKAVILLEVLLPYITHTHTHFTAHSVPFNRISLLLAPTEIPIVPEGTSYRCVAVFQYARSNRESCIVTVLDCPGDSGTLSNPRKRRGAELTEAGSVTYSWGI